MTCARGCCESFADHIRGVQFSGWTAQEHRQADRDLTTDLDAYKRMRDQGLRPGKMRGARNLERAAEIPQEVQMGMIMPSDLKTALKNGDGEIVGLGGKT